jgi:pimeloyl-ACP methyl ester carboxylesterase/cell wall-associated NlpC family hydrolase
MPIVTTNHTRLHYETFGAPQPGRAPILLIHGSTITGRADWAQLAPLLAARYHVIVPDCRGHGQSPNPQMSYSFREMADDMAALVRALGHARAHVIGHSNGGNVALVTLLEHPDVVQTCIPQAANAYVSQDLIDKEPRLFDPDRVAKEAPEWMNEMIALHGATLGPDYWRDLLRLTVRAIISEPNYTPDDLAKVTRPVLVIQGENDTVNAPARHAQFIARHIPHAELWMPPNIGHNVHKDAPLDWLAHVFDFLERRGDDANDALHRLKQAKYRDGRETLFAVRASPLPHSEKGGGQPALHGHVLTDEQRAAALRVVPGAEDRLTVLLTEATPWALVKTPYSDVRREPRRLSERTSQAMLGEAVRLLEERDGWARVRVERDGYLGWMALNTLHRCAAAEAQAYLTEANMLIQAELAQAALEPNGATEAGKLPFAAALPLAEQRGDFTGLRLPDGRVWWVYADDVRPVSARPEPNAKGIAFTLRLIQRSLGVPYLWGGITPFGYDCSGLAQSFWRFLGVSLPRDASQQCAVGEQVESPYEPGDLLFFGDRDPDEPGRVSITHVAISLGGLRIIHSNGTANGISMDSLDAAAPDFRPWLKENLIAARRVA